MKKHILFFIFAAAILALMSGAILIGFAVNEIYFLKPAKNAQSIEVNIEPTSSLKKVSLILGEKKLVSNSWVFMVYAKLANSDRNIKYGTYTITRGESMRRILEILTQSGQNEKTVTIIEGWTILDIAGYLENFGIARTDFLDIAGTPPTGSLKQKPSLDLYSKHQILDTKPVSASLEGYLFPDTYRIFDKAGAREAIEKMLDNFKIKAGSVSYDQLILASIIEREVQTDKDRRMVADIFLKRLEIRMPLQADSTVNYATGKKTPSVSSSDLKIDSPYNTYKYRGLPPTPISNPGLSSINAARNPEPNRYWYFLTDQNGAVHYAKTFEEHSANKQKYLYRN